MKSVGVGIRLSCVLVLGFRVAVEVTLVLAGEIFGTFSAADENAVEKVGESLFGPTRFVATNATCRLLKPIAEARLRFHSSRSRVFHESYCSLYGALACSLIG